ncbi:MAG TPA: hypothetical protein VHT53_04840 [Candidatus Elarobacter sp.]|nr:hypothetical protein [Candidatus Elarobacter sp.]
MQRVSAADGVFGAGSVEEFDRVDEAPRRRRIVLPADVDPAEQLAQARGDGAGRGLHPLFDHRLGIVELVGGPAAERAVVRDLREQVRGASACGGGRLREHRVALSTTTGTGECGPQQHRALGTRSGRVGFHSLQRRGDLGRLVHRKQHARSQQRGRGALVAPHQLRFREQIEGEGVFAPFERGARFVERRWAPADGDGGRAPRRGHTRLSPSRRRWERSARAPRRAARRAG